MRAPGKLVGGGERVADFEQVRAEGQGGKKPLPASLVMFIIVIVMIGGCCVLMAAGAMLGKEEPKTPAGIEAMSGELEPLDFESVDGLRMSSLLLGGSEADAISRAKRLGAMGGAGRPALEAAGLVALLDDDESGGSSVSDAYLEAIAKVAPHCPAERAKLLKMARKDLESPADPGRKAKARRLIQVLEEAGG